MAVSMVCLARAHETVPVGGPACTNPALLDLSVAPGSDREHVRSRRSGQERRSDHQSAQPSDNSLRHSVHPFPLEVCRSVNLHFEDQPDQITLRQR